MNDDLHCYTNSQGFRQYEHQGRDVCVLCHATYTNNGDGVVCDLHTEEDVDILMDSRIFGLPCSF